MQTVDQPGIFQCVPDAFAFGLDGIVAHGVHWPYLGDPGALRSHAINLFGSALWALYGYEFTVATADSLPSRITSGQCAAIQFGHLALPFPSSGAPQRPGYWTLDVGQEGGVTDGLQMQHGALDLRREKYHVVLTVRTNNPTGVEITL